MVDVIVLRSVTNLWTASVYGDPDTHYVHRIRPRPPAPVVIKRCNDYPYYCSDPNGFPRSHYKRLFIALESASSQWQHLTPIQEGILGNFLIDELAGMIFGSNTLAKAGADETVNWQLCRKVFQEVPVGHLCSADPVSHKIAAHLRESNLPHDFASVLRARREIVAHAKAAKFLMTSVVLQGRPINSSTLRITHFILTHPGFQQEDVEEMPDIDGPDPFDTEDSCLPDPEPNLMPSPWRLEHDGLGVSPESIGQSMSRLWSNMARDIEMAYCKREFDPYWHIAKTLREFLLIHPFNDANGRMSRLLLNTLLLKHVAGIARLGIEARENETIGPLLALHSIPRTMTPDEHIQRLAILILKHTVQHFERLNLELANSLELGYSEVPTTVTLEWPIGGWTGP